MNQKFKRAVLAWDVARDGAEAASATLAAIAATMAYAEFINAAAIVIGERRGVEPYASRKATDGINLLTFEKDSAAYQALKAAAKLHPQRPNSHKAEEPVVREALVKKTAKAVIASMIAAGLTKPEVTALLKAVREGITFE